MYLLCVRGVNGFSTEHFNTGQFRRLPVKQLMHWVLSRDMGTFTAPFLNPSHANTLNAPYHRIIRMARKPLLWM